MKYLEKLDIQASETLCFRGSGDASWENIPSIYRDEKFISNEDHIYYDMLSRCSDDFKHCDNTFDNLVMMQHYGVPTRLLDITENPLVALYFACADDEKVNADAKVDIFKIDNSAIKRHDSDTVAMLANLVKMPSDFDLEEMKFFLEIKILSKRQDFDQIEMGQLVSCLSKIQYRIESRIDEEKSILNDSYGEYIPDEYINFLECYQRQISQFLEKAISRSGDDFFQFLNEINEFIKGFYLTQDSNGLFNYAKQKARFLKYQHFIQSEKPYFNGDLMQPNDLSKVICVKPKQDNPHIIRQSGAFFIFGVGSRMHNKLTTPNIPVDYLYRQNGKKVTIHIPKDSKVTIIKQLEALAISAGTLFTDIDKVAADIKNKYRTQ
ncbi:FRG domain-containing protein [Vitreoscilla sp. C1]|uniref:FRG domain-containing protein n=1 Tax=Vitreoscilla sp. (strain C1) TaxID=96942 RepID=UPI001F4853D7|nr:FRG domain-containing protein [Vitreoscilla sp. C1]